MTFYSLFPYNATLGKKPVSYFGRCAEKLTGFIAFCARMAESADATDLKSVGRLNSCASSSLAPGSFKEKRLYQYIAKEFNK